MKDPTIPAPSERKKFMFYDTAKRQVDLKIRLRIDNMNQSMFFRMMISGYLERNESIVCFVEEFRRDNQLEGRTHSKEITRSAKKAQDVKNKFGLNENDIENFFDIMEEEHPEL